MRRFSISLLVTLLVITTVSVIHGQNSDSQKEAERIWELAIQAKGGRERLHSVRNMFELSETQYFFRLVKTKNRTETLFVLPDKIWIWDDNRPSVFGLKMTMYNHEDGTKYFAHQGQKTVNLESMESNQENTHLSGLVYNLMETKWNQPVPEKVTIGKAGNQQVYIVQTILLGKRIDFFLNRKTHLPIKIIGYSNQQIEYDAEFSDYVDVDGIKMLSQYVLGGSNGFNKTIYKVTYQFNVQYNEDIFTSPPLPVESAAEAWKVKNNVALNTLFNFSQPRFAIGKI